MSGAIGVLDLERVAAQGWQGTSTERLGEWLLRAGSGFTGRANSVLPLGSPGCGIDEALGCVTAFYRRHDLPPLIQIPVGPETRSLEADLEARGWTGFNVSSVLVADLEAALARCPARPELPPVVFEPTPSRRWLAGYRYRGAPLPESAVAVLRHAEPVVFASVAEGHDGEAAVVRGAVTQGWLGVTALTVPVSWQRGGVGTYLMGELLRWGAERGAGDVYLQVADENHAALGLYERLGFHRHHGYHYRRQGLS